MAYGTNDGVYFANFREDNRPVRVLALMDVTQVEVLEGYRLLIVLSEHSVITFPLEALEDDAFVDDNLVDEDGDDCMLVARDEQGNVGWAFASFLVPLV